MSPSPEATRNPHAGDPAAAAAPAWDAHALAALAARLRAPDPVAPHVWDLVVVGAGITGAGVARDAARRGLSVLVLDAADLAFGTSSRSTRLIHGGVRYLEQGHVGLVFEALRERARLYANAPHLVTPGRFLFPAYRGDRLGPWLLRLGLTAYDMLALYQGEPHDALSPSDALRCEPLLRADGLRGAVSYEDAITDDARLTLATLQDARRHGAEVALGVGVARLELAQHAGPVEATQRVVLDGGGDVLARDVVVATGPWTSARLLGASGARLVSMSKGVHLVVDARDVPVRQPLVLQVPRSSRIVFVVPWGPRTYLGTTDTAYEGDPGHATVDERDRAELLAIVAHALPGVRLDPRRILGAWSGVRPLVRAAHAREHDTATLSRSHRLVRGDTGAYGIVGGKLTTYRAMAQEVVDAVVAGIARRAPARAAALAPCDTLGAPLVPGAPITASERDASPLLADLAPRHGPRARALVARCTREPALADRVVEDLPVRWVEIDEALTYEGCRHVDDVLRRRLPLALMDAARTAPVARAVAQRLVHARGGDAAQVQHELERYREVIVRESGIDPLAPAGEIATFAGGVDEVSRTRASADGDGGSSDRPAHVSSGDAA